VRILKNTIQKKFVSFKFWIEFALND